MVWYSHLFKYFPKFVVGFPCGSVKDPPTNAGDARDGSLTPGLGRPPGIENGNALHYTYLENSMTEDFGGLRSMGSQRVRHDSD